MTGAEPPRLVHLDLHDTATRFALSFAVDQAGWTRVADAATAHARVTDRLVVRPDAPPVVLVSSRDACDYDGLIRKSRARGFIPKAELSGTTIRSLLR